MTRAGDMVEVGDVLERAANRLSKPGAWTQGADSRDADGNDLDNVDPDDGDHSPVSWCAGGAIFAEAPNQVTYEAARNVLASVTGSYVPMDWNDAAERTQQEVVAKLREAAALARESAS